MATTWKFPSPPLLLLPTTVPWGKSILAMARHRLAARPRWHSGCVSLTAPRPSLTLTVVRPVSKTPLSSSSPSPSILRQDEPLWKQKKGHKVSSALLIWMFFIHLSAKAEHGIINQWAVVIFPTSTSGKIFVGWAGPLIISPPCDRVTILFHSQFVAKINLSLNSTLSYRWLSLTCLSSWLINQDFFIKATFLRDHHC